ncbi:hypothetical protein DFP72DRAFT_785999, partial [Ephemerocybe angulata]
QILGVTCDNASNNDKMVEILAEMENSFTGEDSLTRCFLHVVNLVAKTTIRVFE